MSVAVPFLNRAYYPCGGRPASGAGPAGVNRTPGTGGKGPVQKGDAGVVRAVAEIEAQGGQVLGREITIETGAGRTRLDLLIRNADGELEFIEVKNGPSAKLNPNQAELHPRIRQSGGVPRGDNANIPGALTPDVPIGPTPVRVITYP